MRSRSIFKQVAALSFLLTPLHAETFEDWQQRNFNTSQLSDDTVSGLLAQPNRDGLTNLVKYALGLDFDELPNTAVPLADTSAIRAGALNVSFTRPSDLEDVTYQVQYTSTLDENTPPEIATLSVTTLANGDELVAAQDPNPSAGTPRFARLFIIHDSGVTSSPATNLVATPTSATEVLLEWESEQTSGGFLIERSIEGGEFEVVGFVPAGTNSFQARNLIPGEEVSFRAVAVSATSSVDSTPSESVSARPVIGSDGALVLRFSNISGFSNVQLNLRMEIENTTNEAIPLNDLTIRYWMRNEDRTQAITYRNDFSEVRGTGAGNLGDDPTIVISEVSPVLEGSDRTIDFVFPTATGILPAGGTFVTTGALIRGFQNGDFDPTNDFSFQAGSGLEINNRINILRDGELIFGVEPGGGSGGDGRPDGPVALRTQSLSESSIALSWEDNSTNETLFIIERSFDENEDGFGIVTSVLPNTTSFEDSNLLDDAQYQYRVRAVNPNGVSSATNIASGVTFEGVSPQFTPVTPRDLNISTFSSGRLDIDWTDASRNEFGFVIERRAPGESFVEIGRVPAGVTDFIDFGLDPATSYTYRVTAFNRAGESTSSNSIANTNASDPEIELTDAEITRFLRQAAFGATPELIEEVRTLGFEAWIDQQFTLPPTLHLPQTRALGGDQAARVEAWWRTTLTAPDQVRQRLAFALSQIFVVSQADGDLADQAEGLANYYDMLVQAPESNFRELLEDITFSPVMGNYLDHTRNQRANGNVRPDENYAREIMQLFSIGLNRLNLDGTPILDSGGNPLPTYVQTDIEQVARVFTGLTFANSSNFFTSAENYIDPMILFPAFHENGPKEFTALASDIPSIDALSQGENPLSDFEAIHDGLANHSSNAPFICRQLIQRTVTSNPSPAFIERISRVYEDNGSGVRGDFKAVFKAILLDYEARSLDPRDSITYGKQREPLIRFASTLRMLNASAGTGEFGIGNLNERVQQAPLTAPSVFNFFEPDFALPGAITRANIVSPEFQTTQPSTVIGSANLFNDLLFSTAQVGEFSLDLSRYASLGIPALVTRIEDDLMDGRMPDSMRFIIEQYLESVSPGEARINAALYLVTTSAEFTIEQ